MNTLEDRNQRARAYLSTKATQKAIQKAKNRDRINFILTAAAALGLMIVTIFALTY
jgi:hypothetical protein